MNDLDLILGTPAELGQAVQALPPVERRAALARISKARPDLDTLIAYGTDPLYHIAIHDAAGSVVWRAALDRT